MKKCLVLLILSVLFPLTIVFAQNNSEISDTESKVVELENFHQVIYPLWHTYYPTKDYSALRTYNSEVNNLAEQIYTSKLPGILRDKKEKWENGINEFKTAVNEYSNQTKNNDDNSLLKSVENLHTKYENLVKIIRPVLKEMDQFHKVLYVIYHTHLPEKNFEKIKQLRNELVMNAEAITLTSLPKRLAGKEKDFKIAANSLLMATKDLQAIADNEDTQKLEEAVEIVHSNYQKLEAIF
ncbi:MAG: hypothetical protein WB779_15030 [Ignavibacteriaceae bacterium]